MSCSGVFRCFLLSARGRNTKRTPRKGVMSSAGSGQGHEASVAHRLLKIDVRRTVLNATLTKMLAALNSPNPAECRGMTNTTQAGKEALESKAAELGSELSDLEWDKAKLLQLQGGSSTPAVGAAAPAAPAASAPLVASLPGMVTPSAGAPASNGVAALLAAQSTAAGAAEAPAAPAQAQLSGRKRPWTSVAAAPAKVKAEEGGPASTEEVAAETTGEGAAVASSTAMPEVIDIDCSSDEEVGNGNGKGNGKANGADGDDEGEPFAANLLPAPSLRPDLQAKAAAEASFAFSAFTTRMAKTRRGAEIQRIQERRVNPLAKCNMTERWQCAHSLALAAAVQFGGTPEQKRLTEALLTDLCTDDKGVDKETYSRLADRLESTASEEDSADSQDGSRGVLVDHEKLVEVCESEATLKEYMFDAMAVDESELGVKKRIVNDSGGVRSSRNQLSWAFCALIKHCEVRDEYRNHECYLETWGEEMSDTEASDTDESAKKEPVKKEPVKMEAAKKEAGDNRRPRKKRYKTRGKEVDVLRWNRTFHKHPPGPISSFLADGAPGV